jgi:hypothetical protein
MGSPSSPPSPIPPSSEKQRPHPFEKGRGGWGCILACEGATTEEVEPTSLNRGEGLAAESRGDVRGERARAGVVVERWWWVKESGKRAKFNRDGVDGELKLRSPSKIMFDMDVCESDSEIKDSII